MSDTPATEAPPRVVAVMPAYNAASTLEQTVADIPAGSVHEVILVDDCSRDDTVALARKLGLTVIEHQHNTGYGGNQKTCYRHALEAGADVVVMIHPDYQYDSRVIPLAVEILRLGICDVVIGSRIRTRREALTGGMPRYKYLSNRLLTILENVCLGQNLGDFHSGFRAYRREVLETIPWEINSDNFVFDSQFLAQAVHFGFKLGDIPVPVRYFAEASSINFFRSLRYGLGTLGVLAKFWLHRLRLWRSRLFKPADSRRESEQGRWSKDQVPATEAESEGRASSVERREPEMGAGVALLPFDPHRHAELLKGWRHQPHVRRWWGDVDDNADRREPQQAIIAESERPVGYLRWQRPVRAELEAAGLHDIPDEALDVDILIGDPDAIGRGIGPAAIRLLLDRFRADPSVGLVIMATSAENESAARAFERSGLKLDREFDDPGFGRCRLYVIDVRWGTARQ